MKTLMAAVAASTLAAGGLAACGGGSSDKSSSSKLGTSAVNLDQKGVKGGTLKILSSGDVDFLDPGQTYYQFGYLVSNATGRSLYYVKPGAKNGQFSPDLATGLPQIAKDNKSITVHIRSGVKFSPPVNRVATTKDIKYAFERAFTKEVPNGYAGTYFNNLVGAPAKPNTGDYKPISGIETPNDTTIVFRFAKPVAGYAAQALVLPITIPVPKEYASKFDSKTPSTYQDHVAFTGPYMVKNDAQGKLTGYQAGKEIQLVRNPNWNPKTDFRPAYLDGATVLEGNNDDKIASRQALRGSSTYAPGDGSHPPGSILKQALQRTPKQLAKVASGGGHWASINMTIKPLDNINIRKAMIAILNRQGQRQLAGGPVLGPLMTGVIPPETPGFDEAGGVQQAKGLDWMNNPAGDPTVAKKYMLAAKKDGEPVSAAGKYTGKQNLFLIAANTPDQLNYAQLFKADFAKIGLNFSIHQVPQSTVYTKYCNVPKSKVPVCTSVGWLKDFNDSQTMFDSTFNGRNIRAQGNSNWSQLNDPTINKMIDDGTTIPAGAKRNQYWAKVNRAVMEQAPMIPLTWDDNIQALSKNVAAVDNQSSGSPDISFTWLKDGGKGATR